MVNAVEVFIYAMIAAVVLNILLTKCIVWIVKCSKKQSPMERAPSTAVAIERPVTQQQPKSIREKLYYQFFK